MLLGISIFVFDGSSSSRTFISFAFYLHLQLLCSWSPRFLPSIASVLLHLTSTTKWQMMGVHSTYGRTFTPAYCFTYTHGDGPLLFYSNRNWGICLVLDEIPDVMKSRFVYIYNTVHHFLPTINPSYQQCPSTSTSCFFDLLTSYPDHSIAPGKP